MQSWCTYKFHFDYRFISQSTSNCARESEMCDIYTWRLIAVWKSLKYWCLITYISRIFSRNMILSCLTSSKRITHRLHMHPIYVSSQFTCMSGFRLLIPSSFDTSATCYSLNWHLNHRLHKAKKNSNQACTLFALDFDWIIIQSLTQSLSATFRKLFILPEKSTHVDSRTSHSWISHMNENHRKKFKLSSEIKCPSTRLLLTDL